MKLLYVVWDDASTVDSDPWIDTQEAPKALATIVHSVGWLVEVGKDYLLLTQAVGPHFIAARERIPRGMVKQVMELDPAAGVPIKLRRKATK